MPGSLWSLLTSLSLSLRSEDTPEEEPVVLVVAASKLESERTLASLAWLNSPSPELTDSRRPASSRDTEDTSSVFSRWRSSSRASSSWIFSVKIFFLLCHKYFYLYGPVLLAQPLDGLLEHLGLCLEAEPGGGELGVRGLHLLLELCLDAELAVLQPIR